MTTVLEIIAGISVLLGSLLFFITSIGLLKMPDLYMRISVTTISVTFGLGLTMIGTAIYFNELAVYARAILVVIFVFMTSPVGSHMIGRSGYLDGSKLWEKSKADHLVGKYDLKSRHLDS